MFYLIFNWGCKRDLTKSLKVYLLDKGMDRNTFKSIFNADFRRNIDENPSGDEFDVSLLYVCIQNVCEKVASKRDPAWKTGDDNTLESVCTFIKNFRNILTHHPKVEDDIKMNDLRAEFQGKLKKAIELAGKLYSRSSSDIDDEVAAMNDNIDKIMKAPLTSEDEKYLTALDDFRRCRKNPFKENAALELVSKYESMSRVDPASFITGKERLPVKNVFTRLEVIQEQEKISKEKSVDYEALLTITADGDKPVVTVVEGDAGAGKTTLSKLVLDDWSSLKTHGESFTFQGLDTYDLVLYAEGRNKIVDSFLDLLKCLMPNVCNELTDDDLLYFVHSMSILLIVDGLDELNTASRKFIDDVFDKHIPMCDGKLRLVITTRPNMLKDLPSLFRKQTKVHTRLRGIAREKREEFVQKLHDEMIREGQSEQSTQDLVDYLKQSHTRLGEHYRLPLNLTLLTYLWAYDPARVNAVTTGTGLYIALHELVQERLTERLKHLLGVVKDFSEEREEFLHELYQVCLETLSAGNIQLSSESKEKLEVKCKNLKLSLHEMCAPFLVLEREWTPYGYKFDFFVPHKSIMEFYAAFRIFYLIDKEEVIDSEEVGKLNLLNVSQEKKEEILQILMKDNERRPKKLIDIMSRLLKDFKKERLSDYQNMFLHLGGLLAQKKSHVLEQYAEDLVELLLQSRLKETQWLDLVVETKCVNSVADLVAPQIKKQLLVRDGHTGAALKMFTRLDIRTPVQIILENEVHTIPLLDQLLEDVSRRSCDVELLLKHQWKHSQYGSSDSLVQKLTEGAKKPTCRLSRFWGYLETFTVLPSTVTSLRFSIVDTDHANAICAEFTKLTRWLSIETLGVHIMRGVSPGSLKPLPMVKPVKKECGSLWISDVEDVEWACQVAVALLPNEGRYRSIMLPRSKLSLETCRKLLLSLKKKGVKVLNRGSIYISSDTITESEMYDIRQEAREMLDAENCEVLSCGESTMW